MIQLRFGLKFPSMITGWLLVLIAQASTVLCCNDTRTACTKWSLEKQNECISNPSYTPCTCELSCLSVETCPGNVSADQSCKCRLYARQGDFEADLVTYQALCPTTYQLRYSATCDASEPPLTILHGFIDNSTIKAVYRYMDQIKYDCEPGYAPSGYTRPTMTCNVNGTWYWGAQTGNDTCRVVATEDVLTEVDDFEPTVKEAKGAAVLGTFGIVLMLAFICFVIGLDCLSCKKHIALFRRNIRNIGRWFRDKRNERVETKDDPPIEETELEVIETVTPRMTIPKLVSEYKRLKDANNHTNVKTVSNGHTASDNVRKMGGIGATPKRASLSDNFGKARLTRSLHLNKNQTSTSGRYLSSFTSTSNVNNLQPKPNKSNTSIKSKQLPLKNKKLKQFLPKTETSVV